MSLLAAIPNIVQIVCLFFVPESPRWLVSPIYNIVANVVMHGDVNILRGENEDDQGSFLLLSWRKMTGTTRIYLCVLHDVLKTQKFTLKLFQKHDYFIASSLSHRLNTFLSLLSWNTIQTRPKLSNRQNSVVKKSLKLHCNVLGERNRIFLKKQLISEML